MIYLSTLLMSLFLTLSLIPLLKKLAFSLNVVDVPNERKVHQIPVPKIGGIAMALGIVSPLLIWGAQDLNPTSETVKFILIGSMVIVVFGLWDDLTDAGYGVKFLGQIIAGLIVIHYGDVCITSIGNILPLKTVLPACVSYPLTLVTIVGVTNAVNLSDGLDGLAGGIIILSFMCIAYLAYSLGMNSLSVLALAVIGSVFGFLRFNTHPATIFMGDAGSQLLGFLSITLSIQLTQHSETISPLFPLILLGFPILDTLTVMTGRIMKGRSPFKADKTHFHHRLLALGFHHSEVVFVVYILQSFLITTAFILRYYSEWLLLALYIVFSSTVLVFFRVATLSGWKMTHAGFYEDEIKGTYKRFKERHLPIRISFPCLKYGLLSVLGMSCLAPGQLPGYYSRAIAAILVVFVTARQVRKDLCPYILRISFFLAVPFMLYYVEADPAGWITDALRRAYNISFGLIAVFMVFTLKFTRRKKGFKTTPLDFLILFTFLVMPKLAGLGVKTVNLLTLSVHIIVMLFAYEVIMAESRGQNRFLFRSTIAMFLVLMVRSMGFHFI